MATIITRAGKGSPLTNNEMDSNLINLNVLLDERGNAIDTSLAATGALIPDQTQWAFTASMARFFRVFIPATLTREIVLFNNGVLGIYITTDKKIRINCFGSYETTATLSVSNDWAVIQLDRVDNEASAVTIKYYVNGLPFDTVYVGTWSDLYLRSLIAASGGFWLDVSMGTAALTNAGTTKTENYGDAIGLLRDLGPSAVNHTQSTAAARPLIGRVPVGGAKNIWFNSEYQVTTGLSETNVTPVLFTMRDGRVVNGRRFLLNAGGNLVYGRAVANGTVYNFSAHIRMLDGLAPAFGSTTGSNSSNTFAIVIGGAIANPLNYVIEDQGGGLYRVSGTATAGANAGNNGILKYSTNNSRGFDTSGFQLELGASVTPYQRVGTSVRDVTQSGIPDIVYAFYDQSDDVLTGSWPALSGGTIVLAGRNGIWFETNVTRSASSANIGPTTIPGLPAGILALVGDYLGMFVINRALTAPEKAFLVSMYKAKGSAGFYELGSEILINGGFDTDTDWSKGTDWTIAAGVASKAAGISSNLTQLSVPLTSSVVYNLRFSFTRVDGSLTPQFTGGTTVSAPSQTGAAPNILMTALSGNDSFRLNANSTCNGSVDNISLKAITLNTGA